MAIFKQIANLGILGALILPGFLVSATPLIVKAEMIQDKYVELVPKQLKISSVQLLNGTWQGTYICNQGLTNLKLVINAKSPTNIDAVFYFSAHGSNPTVPSGAFRMKGVYSIFNSPDTPNTLELNATNWIKRPKGFIAVDLEGNVLPNEKRIVGNVLNAPNCTQFDVIKVKNS